MKMKNCVYVVIGSTGEHSDRDEWIVKAFKKESEAMNHVTKASIRALELAKTRSSDFDRCENKNEFDPNFHMDYTGTTYRYEIVELI